MGPLPALPVRRALLTAIQDDAGLAGALLDRLLTPWLEATKQRLRAVQQAGQLRNDVDPEVATELLYGPSTTGGCYAPDRSHRSTSMPCRVHELVVPRGDRTRMALRAMQAGFLVTPPTPGGPAT
jgi:hypothetical protein